jgi:hypothetical protein
MFISLVFAPRFWADYISFRGLWVKESLNKLVVPPLHIGGTPQDPREPAMYFIAAMYLIADIAVSVFINDREQYGSQVTAPRDPSGGPYDGTQT